MALAKVALTFTKISGITIVGLFFGGFIGSMIKGSPAAAAGGNIKVILGSLMGGVIGFILALFWVK